MGDWHTATAAGFDDTPIENDITFTSRRSPFLCRNGCVATSQPLASSIGLNLLRQGANAADVAVAVAASMAVLEPCSTGLGGDMFCLYYESATKQVTAINGSGRSPKDLSREFLERACSENDGGGGISKEKFKHSAYAVTVPGAAQGWEDLWKRHGSGKWKFSDLMEPAAQLAEEGFPVTPVTAYHWDSGMQLIKQWCNETEYIPMTTNGKDAPKAGDVFTNPDMARVLRELGAKGAKEGFYESSTGKSIVEAVQQHGGLLTMEDLQAHKSLFPEPISATYRDIKMWQVPPNGQGVAALIALVGLQHLEETGACPKISAENIDSADAHHVQVEMMRLGFADARAYVSCPDTLPVTHEWLVSKERVAAQAEHMFDPHKAVIHGQPLPSSCTISFQVVDPEGNAVSFVNSNFTGFGTGIVPKKCGFTLQNRGFGFTLNDPNHPNTVAGGKRPYHTIIPSMLTHADTNELYATLSNMGGNMQPQGHMQLMVDMVAADLDPQAAVDKPRFCIPDGSQVGTVFLEEGVHEDVLLELKERGHLMVSGVSGHRRSLFGRAQIIKRDRNTGVLWAGSDGRADGCAMGF